MSTGETPKAETKRHVMALLVASNRALTNALDELGFDQADDRVIDYEGRLAFMTCSHDPDCDDLFALISELASRGESWELVTRIDGEGREVMFNSLARHRPVEAVETELAEDTVPPEDGKIPIHDLETKEGSAKLRADLGKLDPAALFVSVSLERRGRRHGTHRPPRLAPDDHPGDRPRRSEHPQRHPRDPADRDVRSRDEAAALSIYNEEISDHLK